MEFTPILEIVEAAHVAASNGMKKTRDLLLKNPGTLILEKAICTRKPTLERQFALILGPVATLLEKHQSKETATDWPFQNFWINPDEPRHSKLIAYLINPRERHRFGAIFLKRLFLAFQNAVKRTGQELPEFKIDEHCRVGCEIGKIDILVTRQSEDPKNSYAVIIENKINDAKDQKKQLQRYFNYVKTNYQLSEDRIFIFYMPRLYKKPGADSLGHLTNVHVIKFEVIQHWLIHCLQPTSGGPIDQGMGDNLRHYLNLVTFLLKQQKEQQMNEDILRQLRITTNLPSFADCRKLSASANALVKCYPMLLREKILNEMRDILTEKYPDAYFSAIRDGEDDTLINPIASPEDQPSADYLAVSLPVNTHVAASAWVSFTIDPDLAWKMELTGDTRNGPKDPLAERMLAPLGHSNLLNHYYCAPVAPDYITVAGYRTAAKEFARQLDDLHGNISQYLKK